MKKDLMFLLATAAMCTFLPAQAQNVEIEASFPTECEGQRYSLAVYSSDDISDKAEDLVYIGEATADSQSKVSFKFDFAEKSGRYPYIITSASGQNTNTGVLMFTDTDELATAIEEMKKAVNSENPASALKACMTEYSNVFLTDSGFSHAGEIEKLNTSKAYAAMANEIKAVFDKNDTITIDEIRSIYRPQMLLCAAEYGEAKLISEIVDNYEDYLGFDDTAVNEVWDGLSESAKLDAAKMEKGAYASCEEYKAAHAGAVAIAAINASTSYLTMGDIVDKLNTSAALEFPTLSTETRANVLNALAGKKPFASVAAFKAAVTEITTSSGSGSGSGSGGGSSTGGSSGGGGSYIVSGGGNGQNGNSGSGELFGDMQNTQWAKTAVLALAEKGIISGRGNGEFAPADNVTREEFAKILVSAFNLPLGSECAFEDVVPGAWYAPYVAAASDASVVYGIGDGIFGVGMPITRQDACVMLCRAAKIGEGADLAALDKFIDKDDISDYAKEAVALLAADKIVNGMPDSGFAPQKSITRAEAAVIIYNYIGR